MCECFQIGGRFIAEDPSCPIHGHIAEKERREAEMADAISTDRRNVVIRQLQEALKSPERVTLQRASLAALEYLQAL